MNEQAFSHSIERKVAWGDCDAAGIVFYPNYFRMFNEATDELFSGAGFPLPALIEQFSVIGYPMIDTRALFHLPNRFGDLLSIRSAISGWGTSSFQVKHEISNATGLSVEGFEKRVWTCRKGDGSLKGLPVPAEIKDRLGSTG